MKIVFTIIFIAISAIASATDYYISSSGNDTYNGLSPSTPWKTISKVNSVFATLSPGDKILFNRGDTFTGTITVAKSGTLANRIVIGAYGTGANPIVTGFTTLSSLTLYSGSIYRQAVSLASSDYLIAYINGVNTPMGRYPDIGTMLTIDSHSGKTTLTDAAIPKATRDWKGGEVVIRVNQYNIQRRNITDHIGTTLTYAALTGYEPKNGWGYFIQNHFNALTVTNEWCYDGIYFYIYGNPAGKTVKISAYDRGLVISGYDYITVDNINFTGYGREGIYLVDAAYTTIQNCSVTFCGEGGIMGNSGGASGNCVFENNTINEINNTGIFVITTFPNITIRNNTITNCGLIPGANWDYWASYEGIHLDMPATNTNSVIEYNRVENIGYTGISFYGTNTTVRYNFVNNVCLTKQDGGGIYHWSNSTTDNTTVNYVKNNIVLNAIGNHDGVGGDANHYAMGIYIDDYARGITIDGNTVAHCANYGIFINGNREGFITNNLTYNSLYNIYLRRHNLMAGSDVHLNLNIQNNIFFCKASNQYALYFVSGVGDLHTSVITDYNYYARPISQSNVFYYNYTSVAPRSYTLEGWQSYRSTDAHSHKSPISITNVNDIRFEYNASKINKTITLDKPMIDVKGNKYQSSITLLPYTSAVLMVDPDPDQPIAPVYVSSVIENANPARLEMTYNLTLANIIPTASAFIVRVNSVNRTVNTVAVSGTKVLLTLASPVVYGDVVTVAYTKPASNPLQTAAGGQAASITAQNVTNNLAAVLPVYVSSSVANTTPSVIEMTYNLTLANIVPATSAFNVQVNSSSRTVSSVTIVSGKVRLTLSSPVVYGDVVTVAYTKPASNPLQTAAGGQTASMTAQNVTNNVTAVLPVYIGSLVANATPTVLEMTFSLTLTNIAPATSAFTVMVNSVSRSVSSVSISGAKVMLTLSSAVVYGNVVTVAYTKPASNPLQTAAGGQAASLTAQPVTNNVSAILPVYVSSVVANATPTVLEMTYNPVLANIVPAASAFNVRVNSSTRTVSSVAIVSGKVRLTLSSPVVYSDVVTVDYTKPASNPLQTSAGGQAASLTAQPVTNNVSAILPVYVSSVVANATPTVLEMTYNPVLVNIVPATSAFNVQVNSSTRTVSSVAIASGKVRLTLSSPVVYSDVVTVAYTKPASNPLQTSAGGQAASITAQNVTNSVDAVLPVYVSSLVTKASPTVLEMTYNPVLANIVPAASAFNVLVNSSTRTVSSVAIVSGKVRLTLSSPVVYGDVVTVAYTKPASNPLQTAAGGQAASMTAQNVTNNVVAPSNELPLISISSPGKSNSFTAPATLVIDANANDPDGSITKVEFFNGSNKLAELTVAPYSYTWKDVPEGTYSLTAVATDNLNGSAVSVPVTVIVTNSVTSVNQLPVVSISSHGNFSSVEVPATITFTANASDNDGTISKVEYYNGEQKIGESLTAPYTVSFECTKAGNYEITAIATDNLNAVASSVSVTLYAAINNNTDAISLYPNPNDGLFTASMLSAPLAEENLVTVVNVTGKTVYKDIMSKVENVRQFDLSNLDSGIYILMISGNQIAYTKKFIKK